MSPGAVRLCWLQSVCAVAEGADVRLSLGELDVSSRCPADGCVAAVLGDALRRVSVLGGREGMPRSLGSVYGGAVTRFLGGDVVFDISRVIEPDFKGRGSGVAVSRDGSTLLVLGKNDRSHAIHAFSVADGSRLRVVGSEGSGPLQFSNPVQVWVDADDFVFVTDAGNRRVQVLTPTLEFHSFIGVGSLQYPCGVCANADVVVVSEGFPAPRISVFNRRDGSLLRRLWSLGSGDGELNTPCGLCFIDDDRHVAVTDRCNHRVIVFSVDGQFIRHVGVGVLAEPSDIACSTVDELVVTGSGSNRITVLSGSGDPIATLRVDGVCTGVAVHGSTVFVQRHGKAQCIVLTWSTV